jgi:hypothetical protein
VPTSFLLKCSTGAADSPVGTTHFQPHVLQRSSPPLHKSLGLHLLKSYEQHLRAFQLDGCGVVPILMSEKVTDDGHCPSGSDLHGGESSQPIDDDPQ